MRFINLFMFLILLFFVACEEDPTPTGSDILQQNQLNDLLTIDTLDSYNGGLSQKSSTFVSDELNLIGSVRNLLGTYEDDYTKTSIVTVMRLFSYLPDTSYSTALTNGTVEVLSSKLILTPRYNLGDTLANMDFYVRPLISAWDVTEGLLKEDLTDTLYDANVDLKQSSVITEDSLLTCTINNDIMRDWLYSRVTGDSTYQYKGIVLVPNSENRIIGFENSDSVYMPRIETIVKETTDADIDTIVFYPVTYAAIQSVVMEGEIKNSNNEMVVQGAIPIRSKLYFDLSGIPSDAVVNKAELTLTVDSLKSMYTSSKISSVYIDALNSSDTTDISDEITYSLLSRDENTFTGTITATIQGLIKNQINYGFVITALGENFTPARDIIYSGTAANTSDRPRLIIYYSKKK